MKRFVLVISFVFSVLICWCQNLDAYKPQRFFSNNFVLPYQMLTPLAFDSSKKYPLIIFLHGAFEKGDNNNAHLTGAGRFFSRDSVRNNYPSFVLFPQCPLNDLWADFENEPDPQTGYATSWKFPFKREPTRVTNVLLQLIDSFRSISSVDPGRIYIAGISQGGMGVLDVISRRPEIFSAAISICGAGNVNAAKRFKDQVSLWLFHGDKDLIVPPDFSGKIYRNTKDSKRSVRYSEYPGVDHASWVNAFNEPDLLSWLFSQRK